MVPASYEYLRRFGFWQAAVQHPRSSAPAITPIPPLQDHATLP